jgi:hypothetical protein
MRILKLAETEYLGFRDGKFEFRDIKFNETFQTETCKLVISKDLVVFLTSQDTEARIEWSVASWKRLRSGAITLNTIDLPFIVQEPTVVNRD